MGPQLVRCGMFVWPSVESLDIDASMGPQLVRCGMSELMQIIHGLTVASMGPQLVRCGMSELTQIIHGLTVASMGPQLVRCGMEYILWGLCVFITVLQWGRNLFVAECASGRRVAASSYSLQWGRNLFVAECGQSPCRAAAGNARFNGAATCSLRNDAILTRPFILINMLQWGRNLFVAECRIFATGKKYEGDASMGPQLVRCGMTFCPIWGGAASACFNGAATCSLRNAAGFLIHCPTIQGFNGAATCSLRNAVPASVSIEALARLQWGRNLFVAECACIFANTGDEQPRFNGAATCSLRNA